MPFATTSPIRHFSRRALILARLLIVLVALLHGWGSYASAVSSSHDPVAWSEHGSALAETLSPHHGHSHDDPGTGDGGPESPNGHDAADHTHDKSNLPRNGAQAAMAATDDWSLVHQVPLYPAPYFAFDRPPRPLPLH